MTRLAEQPLDVDIAQTRQRLLDAAGPIFAEQGFRAATIRDICRDAHANVAAVNYHFGDKERLYAAVVRYAHRCAMEKNPGDTGLPPNASRRERLYAFVHAFVLRALDAGRPAWHSKLVWHEVTEPTAALDELVEESIRPQFEALSSIIRQYLGPAADPESVRRHGMSVVGQCLFFFHGRAVAERLAHHAFTSADADVLADHITAFSNAALEAASRKNRSAKLGARR